MVRMLVRGMFGLAGLFPVSAHANPGSAPFTVAATAAQYGLEVSVEGPRLRARACPAPSACTPADDATRIDVPEDVDLSRVTVESISLDEAHRVALVAAPHRAGGRWITGVIGGPRADPPAVVQRLKGTIDLPRGVEGERKTRILLREPHPNGVHLSFGTRYENADVCGRPAIIRVKTLDPTTMTWRPAGARSLSEDERKRAPELDAARVEGSFGLEEPRALVARVASSAVGKRSAGATDRDLATRWAERRPAAGRGEFLAFTAPLAVPLVGLKWTATGNGPTADRASAPRRFFVSLDDDLFAVNVPATAGTDPSGTVYEVRLPAARATSCVSVVIDDGFVTEERDQVGFTEIRAITAFDGKSPADLTRDLEGPDADAATALLLRSGEPGVEAAIAAYGALGFAARRRALEVVDTGRCVRVARFYVDRLLGVGADLDFEPALDPTARLARDKLRSCRERGTDALREAIRREAPGQRRVWAARELAGLDARAAIEPIVAVLAEGSTAPEASGQADRVRRRLRGALAIAARDQRSTDAVGALLRPDRFENFDPVTRVDLLRAIGPRLAEVAGGPAAFSRAQSALTDFRSRYLLLEPAGHLAARGDANAVRLLSRGLEHRRASLRQKAVEVAGNIVSFLPRLRTALGDDNPRVRQTALTSLAGGATPLDPALEPRVIAMLRSDRWPFVQIGAAEALGRAARSDRGDEALVEAISARIPRLRQAALRALGRRGSRGAGEVIHDVADDPQQPVETRVAAIDALGQLCRRESSDLLYKLALRAGFQQLPYDQPLGLAALASLGAIKPPDIQDRLARLYAPNSPVARQVQQIARRAAFGPGRCGEATPEA
ncbi:MAG: HEAT repeat domain-containing protein [Myxococcota bacterium]